MENIVSKKLINALKLTADAHSNPYKVNWITKKGETTVKEICTVPLSIGNLYQELACDVLEMDVCHLLLGCPWQYDHNVMNLLGWAKKLFFFPLARPLLHKRYTFPS